MSREDSKRDMRRSGVVGVGCCVLDELLLVDRYPVVGAETAIRVKEYSLQGGGPAATAMAAAARLGARAGFIGKIGDDDRGRRIRRGLDEGGVDISRLVVVPGERSTLSVVCVHAPTGKRSFLMDSNPQLQLRPGELDREYVMAAEIVHLDDFGPAALAAGRWAKQAGRRVSFDAAGVPHDRDVLERFFSLIDVMIVSADFARGFLGRDDPAAAALAIRRAGPPIAAVTVGAHGVHLAAEETFHQPAFPVEVVDTTGAGDVFHGAFLIGLLENWPVQKTAAFAAATAAMSCRALGGREGIPTRSQVFDFLAGRGAEVQGGNQNPDCR